MMTQAAGKHELTAGGRGLLDVIEAVGAWLGQHPGGAIEVGSEEASEVLDALIEGLDTGVLQQLALAGEPQKAAELTAGGGWARATGPFAGGKALGLIASLNRCDRAVLEALANGPASRRELADRLPQPTDDIGASLRKLADASAALVEPLEASR